MLPITFPFALNTPGADTMALLWVQIQQQHPTLGLNPDQHVIRTIQHFAHLYRPSRSVVCIGSLTDPQFEAQFVYDRWPVSRYLQNPLFTVDDIPLVQDMDETALAAFLTQKLNLNIHPGDFLIEADGITYTGGLVRPNWRLQARPDSPFWHGDVVIWLHSGGEAPEPPEEPVDPEPEPVPDGLIDRTLFPHVYIPCIGEPGDDYTLVNLADYVPTVGDIVGRCFVVVDDATQNDWEYGVHFGIAVPPLYDHLHVGEQFQVYNATPHTVLLQFQDWGGDPHLLGPETSEVVIPAAMKGTITVVELKPNQQSAMCLLTDI